MNDRKPIHLFNVHSHITYLMACAVMRHRHIELSDAVFLTGGGYALPENSVAVKMQVIPDAYFLLDFYYGWNYRAVRKNMSEFADFVNHATEGREYIWYPPHTSLPYQKVIASYDKCLNYCVIEEGISPHDNINNLTYPLPPHNKKLMKLCNENRLFFLDDHYVCTNNPKYDCMFVSLDANFAEIDNRVVLPDVFSKERNIQFESADAVLMFDKLPRVLRGGIESSKKVLVWLIENHFRKNKYKKVLFRLRIRGNIPQSEKYIWEVFNQFPDIVFEQIDNSVIMENMIYSYNLPYYFLVTSLGFYAAALGRKSYSYSPTFWALEPNYRDFLTRLDVSHDGFRRFGVELLPAIEADGSPISPVRDTLIKTLKREGIKYAKKYVPLSILKVLQKMRPNF
ncbi:MAG: hypothetical protein ACRC2T_06130 [Thermoguttaceae bacterium]